MQEFSIVVFFFNDTATTEIYTLSLHDALPIFRACCFLAHLRRVRAPPRPNKTGFCKASRDFRQGTDPILRGRCRRSEEHTSELQSRQYLVCRLLLEKKKNTTQHSQVNTNLQP